MLATLVHVGLMSFMGRRFRRGERVHLPRAGSGAVHGAGFPVSPLVCLVLSEQLGRFGLARRAALWLTERPWRPSYLRFA